MKLEPTEEGYWLASGERIGRMTLAEGNTKKEALKLWCDDLDRSSTLSLVTGVQNDEKPAL